MIKVVITFEEMSQYLYKNGSEQMMWTIILLYQEDELPDRYLLLHTLDTYAVIIMHYCSTAQWFITPLTKEIDFSGSFYLKT